MERFNEHDYASNEDVVDHSSGISSSHSDPRSHIAPSRIVYKNLHKFRVNQLSKGYNLLDLTDEQWGLVPLDKCHHISTTCTTRDGPQSYRVRICKTCCQEDSHIELGTYVDQESAILVNDSFEILNNRCDRLIVLRREDRPFLHCLVAKKYDRSKGRDYSLILDLIAERIQSIEGKRLKGSPLYDALAASRSFGFPLAQHHQLLHQNPGNGASSDTSDETWHTDRSRSKSNARRIDDPGKDHLSNSVHSHISHENVSVGTTEHELDSPAPVPIEVNEHRRKVLKPSGASGCVKSGVETVVSDHDTRDSSAVAAVEIMSKDNLCKDLGSSLTPRKRSATFSDSGSYYLSYLNEVQQQAKNFLDAKGIGWQLYGNGGDTNGSGTSRRAADAHDMISGIDSIGGTQHSSTRDDGAGQCAHQYQNPIATLTWLASMEEEEVDVARSLFQLRAAPTDKFSPTSSPLRPGITASDSKMSILSPTSAAAASALASAAQMSITEDNQEDGDDYDDYDDGNDDEDTGDLGVDDGFDYRTSSRFGEEEGDDEDDDDGGDNVEQILERIRRRGNRMLKREARTRQGRGRAYSTDSPTSNLFTQRMREGGGRARSNSMPNSGAFGRNDVIWSILGNIGCYRSKGDPLSVALRKYYERGGATGSGFIGIYSPEDRKNRIARFLEKRKRRMWTKKVKYDVRKNFADSRVRIKGRFVKKEVESGNGESIKDISHEDMIIEGRNTPSTSFATSANNTTIAMTEEQGANAVDRGGDEVIENHSPFSDKSSSGAAEMNGPDEVDDEIDGSSVEVDQEDLPSAAEVVALGVGMEV